MIKSEFIKFWLKDFFGQQILWRFFCYLVTIIQKFVDFRFICIVWLAENSINSICPIYSNFPILLYLTHLNLNAYDCCACSQKFLFISYDSTCLEASESTPPKSKIFPPTINWQCWILCWGKSGPGIQRWEVGSRNSLLLGDVFPPLIIRLIIIILFDNEFPVSQNIIYDGAKFNYRVRKLLEYKHFWQLNWFWNWFKML